MNETWLKKYELAKAYYESNGHLRIPTKYQIDGVNLEKWLAYQRADYNKGILPKEEVTLLDAIGMIWDVNGYLWERNYQIAKEYYSANGSSRSFGTLRFDNNSLWVWLCHQRRDYKANKLSQARIDLLEEIGMIWNPYDEQWYENYELAKQYSKENGHLLIPDKYEIGDKRLGAWIRCQRRRKKFNKMPAEQIKLLERIGMVWDVNTEQWMQMYEVAKSYYVENKHLLVPKDYKVDNIRLGHWISKQRKFHREKTLRPERIKLLEEIGMVWEPSFAAGCSFSEYLIYTYFRSAYGESKVLYRDKTLIGVELDVSIPELKIAIEYDGVWHEGKEKQDETKNDLCEQNGIMLYRFREEQLPKLKQNSHVKIIYVSGRASSEDLLNSIEREFKKGIAVDIQDAHNEYALLTLDWLDTQWQKNYQLAKRYFEENGNLKICRGYKVDDFDLSLWIKKQRTYYKNNELSQPRIAKLEEIGMIWNVPKEQWQMMYELAEEYYKKNGNLLVSRDYATQNVKLGDWLHRQRECYRKHKLSQHRIDLLENIGMAWDPLDVRWNKAYELAKQYFKKNGNLRICCGYKVNDVDLGAWVIKQRQDYRVKKLSPDRIELLEDIGMVWKPHDERWHENYKLAKEYFEKNNNLLIPLQYEIDNIKLGTWIGTQRDRYRKGTISSEQIKKLELIGMVWDTNNERWTEFYEAAKEYYNENGHLLIPLNYEMGNMKMGSWLHWQRRDYKNSKISSKKIMLLEQIGMVWEPNESLWMEQYNLAKEYYDKNKHLLMPTSYKTNGFCMGRWIYEQRRLYKQKKLSSERTNLLEMIGMIWDPDEERWQKNYKLAKEYFGEKCNLLVPQRYKTEQGVKLGDWINRQRHKYHAGTMCKERIEQLENIGMVWRVAN